MEYIGEHLWIGHLGKILVYLALASAFVAMLSNFFAYRERGTSTEKSWKTMARTSYWVHGLSVFGIIGLIFKLMLSHYFEYAYAWEHTSDELPFKYVFSAFWEGQEGSFLLWCFWDVILGFVLIKTAGEWESPVMTVVACVQLCLMSMLLGFYVGEADSRIGVSPFVLLREINAGPIFARADYLSKIKGTGLNPLLQNYWMTIHPPTLFLGFASTVVPFAYAIAGLWTRKHTEWLKPALTWSLFSAGILGTGIAMGGAWAYEALSFGGYWAWDPVENASLVPWLILLAGLHTVLIARKTGHSIGISYIFLMLSFLMIVYSTFLTRSGVLGDSSVHSFTKMGLEWQLVIFVLAGFLFAGISYLANMRSIPSKEKEESIYSREFWMFIGSLILIISSVLITFTTSIPVWNEIINFTAKLFGNEEVKNKLAKPANVVAHYNSFQIWIGILIGFFSGGIVLLRYKDNAQSVGSYMSKWLKNMGLSLGLSFLISIPLAVFTGITNVPVITLMVSATFTILCNLNYVITILKNNLKLAGAAVSHVGFGLLMWGVVYSGGQKEALSVGFNEIQALDNFNPQTNASVLLPKGITTALKQYYDDKGNLKSYYEAVYKSDTIVGNSQIFNILYTRKDASGNTLESFEVHPNILFKTEPDGRKFAASNPGTKHFLSKDVFNVVVPNWVFDDPAKKKAERDSLNWQSKKVAIGDTIYTSKNFAIFQGFTRDAKHPNYKALEGDISVGANLAVKMLGTDSTWTSQPVYFIRNSFENVIQDEIKSLGLIFRLKKILPNEGKAEIEFAEVEPERTYVVLQSLLFPGINLVWLGKVMMMGGLFLAMFSYLRRKVAG